MNASTRLRTRKIMQRIEELAQVSEDISLLTRTYASPAMHRANEMVGQWMRAAGLQTSEDVVGNLIGRWSSGRAQSKTLILGSHLDTVRCAGKYDGPLGVMLAIACVEELQSQNIRLPFDLAILGFADEEGVRFQTTYLGSKAVAGYFDRRDLERRDAAGVSLREALGTFGGNEGNLPSARWPAKNIIGYLEAHIEQGPVLEKNNLAVGVVTSISGQSRLRISFVGRAGHAGTTPMNLRADALCAAAEFILAVETFAGKTAGLVATAGQIEALPGASNVIPGTATLTLDVRHQKDLTRQNTVKSLRLLARQICSRRGIKLEWQLIQQTASVQCAPELSRLLTSAVKREQSRCLALSSGAGHDAVVMAGIAPAAMLFIRCKKGVSHHPAEAVKPGDVRVALNVMVDFIRQLATIHE